MADPRYKNGVFVGRDASRVRREEKVNNLADQFLRVPTNAGWEESHTIQMHGGYTVMVYRIKDGPGDVFLAKHLGRWYLQIGQESWEYPVSMTALDMYKIAKGVHDESKPV